MRDIIHQYGKAIIAITFFTVLLSYQVGSSGRFHLYRIISEALRYEAPAVSNAAEIAAEELFLAESAKVCPRTDLKAKQSYLIKDIMTPATGEKQTPAGGKARRVLRLYDGPEGKQELRDVSDTVIKNTGKNVSFPSRGLYLLTLSVRDQLSRRSLQYMYISIEGTL